MNCLRVVPLTTFEFAYYDLFSTLFENTMPFMNIHNWSLLAGCFGGGFAYTTVYPIDFSRTMIAINSVPSDISFIKTFSFLWKKYGFMNMFKGLGATWVGVFPYVGLKFYFYE